MSGGKDRTIGFGKGVIFIEEYVRSVTTVCLVLVEVGYIIVASKGHVAGLVGDPIIGLGGNIVHELVNSCCCVFCGCILVGAY